MKNLICGAISIMLATLIAAAMPTEAEARIYEDTLRLHILAASDSDEDQELKLYLRDKLLSKYGEVLSGAESVSGAASIVSEQLDSIKADCEHWVKEAGYDYSISCELCKEWYDTREYESFTLPKGEYLSLKIKIGAAKGKNWWCVMFPPLCLDAATENTEKNSETKYSKEETALITNKKYKVKFKLLELFSSTFFKNG